MPTGAGTIRFGSVVLDCPDPRELASFYARLLGWRTREDPEDDGDWVMLDDADGAHRLSFQRSADYQPPTWPDQTRPQMLHLDLYVDDMDAAHEFAVSAGARLLDDSHKEFRVFADPAGHPFCLCV
ncbi:VOC family protein [Goodfellowiella coeruleoviolacea]